MVQEMHQGSWDDKWVLQPFCHNNRKRLEPTVVQLLLFLPSDDAAAAAPAAAVPAGAAPHTRGQDQMPALRAARAVLKQQLKESTKEIRKEAGATQIPILVGEMSPELVNRCMSTNVGHVTACAPVNIFLARFAADLVS